MKTKRLLKITSIITLVSFIISTTGCTSYFRVRKEENINSVTIEKYCNQNKYVIIQNKKNAWNFQNFYFKGDTIIGYLNPFLDYHLNYLNPSHPKGLNSFLKNSEPDVIQEVHIYTSDTSISNILDTIAYIPISAINKIEIYDYDKSASKRSWILPTSLIIVGVATIVIVRISLSNMPSLL